MAEVKIQVDDDYIAFYKAQAKKTGSKLTLEQFLTERTRRDFVNMTRVTAKKEHDDFVNTADPLELARKLSGTATETKEE